ncbi:hypothetical protein DPMN_068539 [Dreissena polymorpha]|uniref:Uncharacterized protein n=1 Tax=Dreissena polymorpha TaxID=45954 RepID=A0A9D3Z2P1_DREPO|nr:hypothetical protein DPMN_068539 [Dreissena polymorpha]
MAYRSGVHDVLAELVLVADHSGVLDKLWIHFRNHEPVSVIIIDFKVHCPYLLQRI